MSTTSSATSAAAAYLLQGQPQAAAGSTQTTAESATSGQATTGTQAAAQPQAEPFNAPMLNLPEEPTTADVMDGLTSAMSAPGTNDSTAQRLYEFHQEMMQSYKTMVQAMIG